MRRTNHDISFVSNHTSLGGQYELRVQEDYLIVLHARSPRCLLFPRHQTSEGDDFQARLGLSVEDSNDFPHLYGRRMPFDAIFGIYWLLKGPYLALVTESNVIGRGVDGKEIRQVTKIELMLIPTQNIPLLTLEQEEDERRYIEMLTSDVDDHKLHFSYDYDLTHSLQRIASFDEKSGSIAERADRRFCWNYGPCSPLVDQNLFDWIVPITQAYIEIAEDVHVNSQSFKIVYISRRSCRRQGTRFTMRGIDEEGNVANFVETEHICLFADGRQTSFVQIRGSIPIFWSSPVSMKYAPQVFHRGHGEKDVEAYQRHAYELMQLYGRIVIVNLIDKKKEQLKLGEALGKVIADAATKDSHLLANIRLVWFDFHHECRKMRWFNLQKLIQQVDTDFQDYGYFCKNGEGQVLMTQSGIVRTNCMDNLDRTNVVQSLFARRSLLLQLNQVDALRGNVLHSPFQQFENVFKRIWGNNADAISLFYAGTGALKTDFTRTGKRTKKGVLMDGYNSCVRYIKNNFMDGHRQDVLDLLLGRYQVSRQHTSPFQNNMGVETLESLLAKVMGIMVAIFLFDTYQFGNQSFMIERFFRTFFVTMTLVFIALTFMIRKGTSLGKRLVQLPKFRPQDGCMTTWK